jgi:hypothetical protein
MVRRLAAHTQRTSALLQHRVSTSPPPPPSPPEASGSTGASPALAPQRPGPAAGSRDPPIARLSSAERLSALSAWSAPAGGVLGLQQRARDTPSEFSNAPPPGRPSGAASPAQPKPYQPHHSDITATSGRGRSPSDLRGAPAARAPLSSHAQAAMQRGGGGGGPPPRFAPLQAALGGAGSDAAGRRTIVAARSTLWSPSTSGPGGAGGAGGAGAARRLGGFEWQQAGGGAGGGAGGSGSGSGSGGGSGSGSGGGSGGWAPPLEPFGNGGGDFELLAVRRMSASPPGGGAGGGGGWAAGGRTWGSTACWA